MKKSLRYIILLMLLFLSSQGFSEIDCVQFPLDPECDGDPDTPIDSGVGLLIGAVALYSVKKIREKRNSC